MYARAHGRIGEKNTTEQGEKPRGHDEGLRKNGRMRKREDAMKMDGGRGERGRAAGERTGDLAQRGSKPRRKRRFVSGYPA